MRRRPRGPSRVAGALLVVSAATACGEAEPPRALALRAWPGDDGIRVALDQVLRFEFSAPLAPPVRRSAVVLREVGGGERTLRALDVAGRYLSLVPELPRTPGLDDGSLRPGRRYAVTFRGVPALNGLVSADGAALVGDRTVEFATLPADAPGLFSGEGAEPGPVALASPAADDALHVASGRSAVLRFRAGLDPRSLVAPAQLAAQPGEAGRRCALTLLENEPGNAVVLVDVGDWSGWGVLTLPESLRGLDGSEILPAHRQLRIHCAP